MRTRLVSLLGAVALLAMLPGCAFISRASETATGTQGDSVSSWASLSENGRWVAFRSFASNLVPGDTNGAWDVFVRDNLTKQVVRVSVASDGTQGNGRSESPSISNDGSRIAFASDATNLDGGDTNGVRDVYIHDRDPDDDGVFDEPTAFSTARVSNNPFGTIGTRPSDRPQIHGDGYGVVYESASTPFFDAHVDVYSTRFLGIIIWTTTIVSAPLDGSGPANVSSFAASVNVDGGVIAFATFATNLFPGDTNGTYDVVVRDARGTPFGRPTTLRRVTGAIQGDSFSTQPSVSDDGGSVAFVSAASNLVPGETGFLEDVFVADLDTGAITAESRTPTDASANGYNLDPSISGDGTRVSYTSSATDLAPGDGNGLDDIIVRDRASNLTQIASTAFLLEPANGVSLSSVMSDDGRYVAFDSMATSLVTPDANGTRQDVFTRAAVVPRIDSVARVGSVAFGGPYEAAPRLGWGWHTLRITGKGFGPGVSVALGAGVTVLSLQSTPTQIDVEVRVADGSGGARDLTVSNVGLLPINSVSSSQVCSACVAIQRWVTVPDPVPSGQALVRILSNNEFTPATNWPGISSLYISTGELWVQSPTFQSLPTGSHDVTLEQTVDGTVTCSGCLHAP